MKRFTDVVLSLTGLIVLSVPMALIALLVRLTSPGPAVYWSVRVGKNNRTFHMPKFRTMRTNAPEVATRLLTDTRRWITPVGRILRSTSLDELPQLWCVLRGEMSLVGPRPVLESEQDLISLRTTHNVHLLSPGVTGWAQIRGRDELSIPEKVAEDYYYLQHRSWLLDLKILLLTVVKVARREGIVMAGDKAVRPLPTPQPLLQSPAKT